jgi:branched-subunit amino acid transport protein
VSGVWTGVLVASVACYLAKLAGLSVPDRVLRHPRVSLAADLLPIALLSALVAVQVFGAERALVLDARVVGLGVAVVALLLRAPFLVVVAVAALTAAAVRAAT